jgi:hypothetical protein
MDFARVASRAATSPHCTTDDCRSSLKTISPDQGHIIGQRSGTGSDSGTPVVGAWCTGHLGLVDAERRPGRDAGLHPHPHPGLLQWLG